MKTHIKLLVLSVLVLANMNLFAQREKLLNSDDVEGLYLTLANFKQGKLTRPTDEQHEGDKIKLKQFFISPDIISIEQNKKTVFYKDSIFAIHLTNGKNYRFINRNPFLIADTSSLYIYTYKTKKTVFSTSGPHRRSKDVPVTYYYFSLAGENAVYTLTLANVRKYALTDPTTHIAVCNKFTTDEMLYQINPQTGRFDLNETILSIVN
ncbi:MAG: hypothetical protein PHP53_18820 [Prolixibacteraceae bacterium]|nr:hypothetical protein [Prolixibacteraceae bacterium]